MNNYDTTGHPDWPFDDEIQHVCDNCHKELNEYENVDPCVIDHKTLCDECASDLTLLRMGGYIKSVKSRTEVLRDQHFFPIEWDAYKAGKL